MYKLAFVFIILVCACSFENSNLTADTNSSLTNQKSQQYFRDTTFKDTLVDSIAIYKRRQDSVFVNLNLCDVQKYNSKIKVDLKYRTTDNFFKVKYYKYLDRAFLNNEVAMKLAACQNYLTELDSNLYLLIYDAVRPVDIQKKMWRALDSIPPKRRGRFVSSGRNLGMHNMGLAVDITICDSQGIPLDMGANFDDIREIAYPSKESYYLGTGELTQEHINNRKLLRKVMTSQGFWNLSTEWWHFTIGRHKDAVKMYPALYFEPGFEK